MKFLIILAIVATSNAAPSGWGHGLALAGPHLAGAAVAGPHAGPAHLAGAAAGPTHVSGAVAGPALVTGSVAGPAAVIGASAGHTLVSEPAWSAWDDGLGWEGHGAVLAGGHLGLHGVHGGPVLVAGPDGSSISAHGAGHGAIIAGNHAHGLGWLGHGHW